MAGVSPVMAVGMGTSVLNGVSALKQIDNTKDNAAQAYQSRLDEINAQSAAAERTRQATHDRVSAQQRARFASKGIVPSEGSSAAVLKGLQTMSEAQAEDHSRQLSIAKNRADLSYSQATGANLLTKKVALFEDNLDKLLKWG